jgi:hypothetical protein
LALFGSTTPSSRGTTDGESGRGSGTGTSRGDDCDDGCGFLPVGAGASRFISHTTAMLDLLRHELGPDVESLDSVLNDLGRSHAVLGVVEPELFEVLLSCLVDVVDGLIGLSDEARTSWNVVVRAVTNSLTEAVEATILEPSSRDY